MNLTKNQIDKIKKKFNSNGYVVVKKIFDKKNILQANENLFDFLEINKNSIKKKDINLTKQGEINSVHNFSKWPWTKKFHKDSNLQLIVSALLNVNKPKSFGAELFAKPARSGMPAPIHQDNYYWCIDDANGLTVWIALNDSNEQNGGIYYYKKSHKIGILEHKPSYAPGSSQTIKYPDGLDVFDTDLPNLNAGDCLIHHCLVVHGSKPNKSNHPRIGCTLRYISKNSKIDKFMQYKYNESLDKHFKKLKR